MQDSPHKPSEKYVYIFVRQDIPLVQQIVQSNHATWQMSAKYGDESIPNIVLIGVPDIEALNAACRLLSENQIPHWSWTDPDFDFGFASIATAPISGLARQCLAHYRLWKEEFTDARGGIRAGFSAERPPVCAPLA